MKQCLMFISTVALTMATHSFTIINRLIIRHLFERDQNKMLRSLKVMKICETDEKGEKIGKFNSKKSMKDRDVAYLQFPVRNKSD